MLNLQAFMRVFGLAEQEGFEPSVPVRGLLDFECFTPNTL